MTETHRLAARLVSCVMAFTVGACGRDDFNGEAAPDGSTETKSSAIVVAERVFSPEGRSYYVSVVADVPDGPLDRSRAREFSSADIEVFDGSVFLRDRESNTMTRFSVSDGLELVEQASFSFQNTGLGTGRVRNAYVSASQAFAMDPIDWRLIEWNPTTMELTGEEISIESFSKEGLPDGFIGPARRVGDRLVAHVGWSDYENLVAYPAMGAMLAIDGDSAEVELIEDDRLGGGFLVYGEEDGTTYLPGVVGADMRLFGSAAGGGELPPSGVVRIKPGAAAFDSEYFINVSEITGSPGVWALHRIDDTRLLAQIWDPEVPTDSLTSADDYYAAQEFIYVVIDTESETFEEIESIPRGGIGNAFDHIVDSQLYVQTSVDLGGDQFEASVHAVEVDGTVEAFTVPSGDLWHLERIR